MAGSLQGPVPGQGRVYREDARVGAADADPNGRCRIDAIARYLQDVAYADLVDAELEGAGVWIVRRTRIVVERFPRFFEQVRLETWCSAMSKLCAERRTSLVGDAGARVEALSLWVQLEADGRAPRRLDEKVHDVYGPSADGRRAKSKLLHPPPPGAGEVSGWSFRATDLDLAGHVNNAALWQVLEQRLIDAGSEPQRIDAEIEYRRPATLESARVLEDAEMTWLIDPTGEPLASIRVTTR